MIRRTRAKALGEDLLEAVAGRPGVGARGLRHHLAQQVAGEPVRVLGTSSETQGPVSPSSQSHWRLQAGRAGEDDHRRRVRVRSARPARPAPAGARLRGRIRGFEEGRSAREGPWPARRAIFTRQAPFNRAEARSSACRPSYGPTEAFPSHFCEAATERYCGSFCRGSGPSRPALDRGRRRAAVAGSGGPRDARRHPRHPCKEPKVRLGRGFPRGTGLRCALRRRDGQAEGLPPSRGDAGEVAGFPVVSLGKRREIFAFPRSGGRLPSTVAGCSMPAHRGQRPALERPVDTPPRRQGAQRIRGHWPWRIDQGLGDETRLPWRNN